ncbi:MAG: hypothetical protein EOM59_08150 [Clostridia bacterium]|nr:hypothetical protein [Clostridia bacterium]
MKNNRPAFFVVFVIMMLFFALTVFTYGDEPVTTEVYIPGADVTASFSLDMWHYSGGYWKVGNAGSDKITIEDEAMRLRGVQGILADQVAEFAVDLSAEILEKISEGKEILAKPVAFSTPLTNLFDTNSFELSMSGDKLYFSAKPWFNLIQKKDLSFSSYGLNLSKDVPLIDRAYGYNIYSLFGNGESGAQSAGRINRLSPDVMEAGYVHPGMITGLDGALESGHTIYIRGSAVGSAGYSVGNGTFAAGGAVGLSFSYPVKFQFYEVVEGEVPPIITPPAITPPAITQTDVTAVLELPAETYEGHTVLAQDISMFEVEGEAMSATEVYAQNLASNSFRIVESGAGNVSNKSDTSADVTFNTAGNFNVRLNVNTTSGQSDWDTKPITVKRTPCILHSLGGTQKQNRKQSLFVTVAQNPAYPIMELWVELEDAQTGESVRLAHQMDGSANTLLNNDTIKTRAIIEQGSSDCFVKVQLDFITKNTENQNYIYRVFAEDTRGYTDSAEVLFPVAKDNPPLAEIQIDPLFLRGKGSNTAQIIVEDVSVTDGDQLRRTWYYSPTSGANGCLPTDATVSLQTMPGYKDMSFGTGKMVAFNKEGVGPLCVALEVQDIWTEETLPEYILPSDYLTAEASAVSEVDNVAPVVSLKAVKSQTAEILIFAKDKNAYDEALNGKTTLSQMLLAEGIDANIIVEHVTAAGQMQGGLTQNRGTLTVPYGFQGTWSGFWEDGSFTADEKQVYKAEATWVTGATDYDCYPTQPYTLRAYESENALPTWTYTLSASHFPMGNDRAASAFFGHDSQGRFLYWMINGKTIILDKQTGAELTILPFLMSENNCVSDSYIFCFKSDGIYSVSMADGSIRKIFSESIFIGAGAVKTIAGKETFMVKRGTELLLAAFEPKSQVLTFRRLEGTAADGGTATTHLVGMDSAGVVVASTIEGSTSKLRTFDRTGRLLNQQSFSVSQYLPNAAVPIYDSGGRIHYVGIRSEERSSTRYSVSVNVRGIYNSYSQTVSFSDPNGYPTEVGRLLFGVERPSGEVFVGLGAEWTYIANSGYNNGPAHGLPQRAKVYTFNTTANTCAQGSITDFAGGLNSVVEYGYGCAGVQLISTGANHQVMGAAYHSTSVIGISQTEASQISQLRLRHISETADISLTCEIQENFSPDEIVEQLVLKTEEGKNVLGITAQTATGSVSKNFTLRPGKTYYYEYKTTAAEDILTATAQINRFDANDTGGDSPNNPPTTSSGAAAYKVIAEMAEDFNGSELNPYFELNPARVESGKYNAAKVYLYQGSNWKNYYRADASGISFTVPAGIQGILSFDYDILRDSGWMANFFTLSKDGGAAVIWDEFVSGSKQGRHTNRRLLEPGSYVLTAFAGGYGGRLMDYYTKVDNLRMVFVEASQDGEPSQASILIETQTSLRCAGDRNVVKGSFTAPPCALAYSTLDVEYVQGTTTSYSAVSGEPGRYVQTVSIPGGRAALYLNMGIWSSPTLTSNYNNVTFTWGGYQWICAYNNRYPQSALTNIPRNYNIASMGSAGTQIVEQRSATYRNAYGGFSGVEMVLSKQGVSVPQSVLQGQFVLADKNLFFESATYEGVTEMSFCPGQTGETQISDLTIYSIENGSKVYVEDVAFSREAVLQEWKTQQASTAIISVAQEEEMPEALVFQKGDFISYPVFYDDYEGDPSKVSYWKYTHTPMNDGLHPLNGQVLTSPINRFYVDGKYVLEHWQEDDASRSGNSPYDKASNVCVLTFYIEGAAQAPWITYIRTNPSKVKVGDSYTLQIGVDDKDKDILNLTTEVYFGESPGLPFFTHFRAGIAADALGRYPRTDIPIPYSAAAGRYDIVSIVRDALGAGLGTYRFTCISPIGITGQVFHTQEWDSNRKNYNVERFHEEGDAAVDFARYRAKSPPGLRATNVFWPGERLCLRAQAGGAPTSVTATMLENPSYTATLAKAGPPDAAGQTPYTGFLWHETMQRNLSSAAPILKTIRFTAIYPDGALATCDVEIIFDQDTGYWRLHRLY